MTGGIFSILECNSCGLKFTNPRPEKEEISGFYDSEEYLSHNVEKKNIKSYLYRIVRKINLRSKLQIITRNSTGNRILDIGCGTGEFLAFCKNNKLTVHGIEPNDKAREYGIEVHGLTIEKEEKLDSLPTESFDVITMWHVLEHVPDLKSRMKKIRQLLCKDGTLFLAVPNSKCWDAAYYKEFWAAYDLPRHLYHFDNQAIIQLAAQNGFEVVKRIPMKWDAFYISLLSEQYKKNKFIFLRAFFNGMRSNFYASRNQKNYSSIIYVLK